MTGTRFHFAVVIFLAAFLLFLVEPIVAKQLVPVLGGSAAVWITCLVFFQTALLCAYAYAHWVARRGKWVLHLALLTGTIALAMYWAFGSVDLSSGPEHPVATIFYALTLWIGLPFIALGATSPLLQYWWSRVEAGPVPYKLFALSNLASLLALAAYPTLIEPRFTLHTQRVIWFWGLMVFIVLAAGLTLRSRSAIRSVTPQAVDAELITDPEDVASPTSHKWLWFLLPMGASMQLAAITSFITSNLAAIPLFWILPLGVYLLSIIISFEYPRLLPPLLVARSFAVMLASTIYMVSRVDVTLPLRLGIAFVLIELFLAGLFLHSQAYLLRPRRASESTMFYLLFAGGGAVGSFIAALVFPAVFSFNYDVAVVCFFTALLVLACLWRWGWSVRLLWITMSAIMLFASFRLHFAYEQNTIVAVRNFYASLRVKQTDFGDAKLRTLTNGTIEHGRRSGAAKNNVKPPRLITQKTRASDSHCVSAATAVRATSVSLALAPEPSLPTDAPAIASVSTRSIPPSFQSPRTPSLTSENPALKSLLRTATRALRLHAKPRSASTYLQLTRSPAIPFRCICSPRRRSSCFVTTWRPAASSRSTSPISM